MKHILLLFALCASLFSFSQQPGKLDSIFGVDGRAYTTSVQGVARKIHAYADGRILAAGHTALASDSTCNIQLTQFTDNGTLDSAFGTNGVVAGALLKDSTYYNMRVLNDGKIVVMSNIFDYPNTIWQLQKFNSNGTPDTNFGVNGLAQLHIDSVGRVIDFLVQPDQTILLVGALRLNLFTMVRVTPSGSIDSSYGVNGRVNANVNYSMFTPTAFKTAALQQDGKILIGATAQQLPTLHDFALIRIQNNGVLDSTFGVNGKAFYDNDTTADFLTCVTVLPNGKILAGGFTQPGFPYSPAGTMVRFTADGRVDSTFGSNGSVGVYNSKMIDIVIQPDSRILCMMDNNSDDSYILRYNQNGTLDNSFGYNGGAYPDSYSMFSRIKQGAIAYASNNKIVLTSTIGYHHVPTQHVLVARFNTDLYYPVCSTTYSSFSATRCANQPYSFFGSNYNETGIYTDTIQNVAGCDSVVTLNLQVIPLTPVSFNLPDSLCSNVPIILTASPAGGMFTGTGVIDSIFDPYDNNQGYLFGLRGITYMYTDTNYCTNSIIDSINVVGCDDEATTCHAAFSFHEDTLTPHHWYLLNESSETEGTMYVWYWGDNRYSYGDTPSHVYTSGGHYVICLYVYDAVNNCESSYCDTSIYVYKAADTIRIDVVRALPILVDTVVVEEPVSITNANGLQLRVVPNPTNGIITISANLNSIAQVSITDNLGRVIYTKQLNGMLNEQVDMSSYASGLYVLNILGAGINACKKLVKN